MAWTVQTVKTVGLAPSDLQALREIAGNLARQAKQAHPVLSDRQDLRARPECRATRARLVRRALKALRVRKATPVRLLKRARPGTRVRS